jgi:diguanylate cyclase (GGDEF)-like protein/PAS domain S-box-containing protein
MEELVARLAKTEAAIQSLVAGQADAVVDPRTGAIVLLREAQQAVQESQARYHRLITHLSAIIFELAPDGTVLFVNDAIETATRYTPAGLMGKSVPDIFFPGEQRCRWDAAYRAVQKGDLTNYEMVLAGKDGTPAVLEVSTANRYKDGALERIIGFAINITARKHAEEKLRQAAVVFERTPNAIMVADSERRVMSVNQAFVRITGYAPEDVIGKNPRFHQSGRQGSGFYQEMWERLEKTGEWQGEIWNRRKNGDIYPAWEHISAVTDKDGHVTNYISVFSDISVIKESEAKLDYLAHHDTLTGAANRSLLAVRLDNAMQRSKRRNERFALLYIDLDRFKSINDMYGHDYGDQVLKIVSERIQSSIREEDMLARIGGDEFVVIMETLAEPHDAALLAEKIIEATSKPIILEGRDLLTSVSLGISVYPDDGTKGEDLINAADAAMYSGKQQGRATYQFSSAELTKRALEYFSLQNQLRHALLAGEFSVHYQPQVSLATGQLVGVEALARWRYPDGPPPEKFIPVAEDIGLIDAIGEWVLQTACTDVAAVREQAHASLRLAVNVSGRQVMRNRIVERVPAILAETHVQAGTLELEITESVLQDARGVETLQELRALGVHLAIDDFGTGYSSLSQLKHMPIDTLKIDQSFVHDLPDNPDSRAIAAAIIGMAHTLDLRVVAEGVETQEQLQFLRDQGCDEAQGHFVSPPLLPADLRRFVQAHRSA